MACDGFPVVRLNTLDGGVDVVDLNPDQWDFLPGKYDVAVVELPIEDKIHKASAIPTYMFSHKRPPLDDAAQSIWRNHIGVGDDVFMLGLFVDHDGVATNVPSARFGNVSMMPNESALIEQPTGYKGISYVVDMHSRTGFSGSPVFVYRTFGSNLSMGLDRLEFPIFG